MKKKKNKRADLTNTYIVPCGVAVSYIAIQSE